MEIDEDEQSRSGTTACLRCRTRKIRCDRGFPKCKSCEKLGHPCLTKDPSSGRVVPRSYLAHLEKRVKELEKELAERTVKDVSTVYSDEGGNTFLGGTSGVIFGHIMNDVLHDQLAKEGRKYPASTVSKLGPITVPQKSGTPGVSQDDESAQASPNSRTGDATTTSPKGTASKSSAKSGSTKTSTRSPGAVPSGEGEQDAQAAAFSLSAKNPSQVSSEPLPSKRQAEEYLQSYFTRSNPQMPILHREQFIKQFFEPIYGCISSNLNLAAQHTVMALERTDEEPHTGTFYRRLLDIGGSLTAVPEPRIRKCLYFLFQAFAIGVACMHRGLDSESTGLAMRLHHTAMQHYTHVISSSNRFMVLQSLLLLGVYSLMRPAHPGVWFVVGTSMRMCIEMGLHNEERMFTAAGNRHEADPLILDMGRRLFWCTYALDRQVSMYLGRPTALDDDYISVPLFSMADDSYLLPGKSVEHAPPRPSYKWVAYYMIRIRRIQHKIKYHFYDRADAGSRAGLPNESHAIIQLRESLASELEYWHDNLPRDTHVYNFEVSPLFFDLNYHQSLLLLYGVSPARPHPSEQDMSIALGAGIKILETYVKVSTSGFLNYSWVSTHNIFQAAASCLYVLHQTQSLHGALNLGPFEELIKQSLEVIASLKSECHAAHWCYESLGLMSSVTLDLLKRQTPAMETRIVDNVNELLRKRKEADADLHHDGSVAKRFGMVNASLPVMPPHYTTPPNIADVYGPRMSHPHSRSGSRQIDPGTDDASIFLPAPAAAPTVNLAFSETLAGSHSAEPSPHLNIDPAPLDPPGRVEQHHGHRSDYNRAMPPTVPDLADIQNLPQAYVNTARRASQVTALETSAINSPAGSAAAVESSKMYDYLSEMSQMLIWDSFTLPPHSGH